MYPSASPLRFAWEMKAPSNGIVTSRKAMLSVNARWTLEPPRELQTPRQCRVRVWENHAVSTGSSTRAASARHLDVN
jgi:hypothetical protein